MSGFKWAKKAIDNIAKNNEIYILGFEAGGEIAKVYGEMLKDLTKMREDPPEYTGPLYKSMGVEEFFENAMISKARRLDYDDDYCQGAWAGFLAEVLIYKKYKVYTRADALKAMAEDKKREDEYGSF
jgi:hypothetical protein